MQNREVFRNSLAGGKLQKWCEGEFSRIWRVYVAQAPIIVISGKLPVVASRQYALESFFAGWKNGVQRTTSLSLMSNVLPL